MPAWMVTASMVGFGSMARDSGVGLDIALGSSLGIWGLPGQVAMTELFALGAPVLAIVVASSMANLRFMPMAVVMMPYFKGDARAMGWRYFIAHLMSINIWSVFMVRGPAMPLTERFPFYLGLSLVCMTGGAIGTILGYLLAAAMPFYVSVALVFLNPAYFVFIFSSVRVRNCLIAVVIGAIMGPLLHQITPDWGVPITGVVAGTIAFGLDRMWSKPS